MPYEREELDSCGVVALDLTTVAVVAVSGTCPNICGHLLLYTPANGGYYFHVSRVYAYPYYSSSNSYNRYLRERQTRASTPTSQTARSASSRDVHGANALRRVVLGRSPAQLRGLREGVIQAGGGEWNSYSNCPV
jgi:hypothetical protein